MEQEETIVVDEQQSRFSDVLAALVSGIARARAVADKESMYIAEIYKQNEYLKGLSIPRLRLSKILIDLPVLVKGCLKGESFKMNSSIEIANVTAEAIRALGHNKDLTLDHVMDVVCCNTPFSKSEFNDSKLVAMLLERRIINNDKHNADYAYFSESIKSIGHLRNQMSGTGITDTQYIEKTETIWQKTLGQRRDKTAKLLEEITREEFIKKFRNTLSRRLNEVEKNLDLAIMMQVPKADIDIVSRIKEILVEVFTSNLEEMDSSACIMDPNIKAAVSTKLQEYIFRKTMSVIISAASIPPDLSVTVLTDKVKNESTPGSVMKIQMVVYEEGVQWRTETNAEGSTQWKLTPE